MLFFLQKKEVLNMKKIFSQMRAAFRVRKELIQVKVLPFRGYVTLSKSHSHSAHEISRACISQGRGGRGGGRAESRWRRAW